MKKLSVSVYFMVEWWDKYFHNKFPRPEKPCQDALDALYLARKRFLFEHFGRFGLGEEFPVMDGKYVSLVIKYGMDLIPYLFGAKLTCQEAGGYMPTEFSYEQLSKMTPVDIAAHPFGDWVMREKERMTSRYGMTSAFLDYESATNIAFRLRGMYFYSDLIEDPSFAQHVLSLSLESIKNILAFQRKAFPPTDEKIISDYQIGNCNVTMLSPDMYTELIRSYDIDFAEFCYAISEGRCDLLLHHCDVEADSFIEAYSAIPHIGRLQASHKTDIAGVLKNMPGTSFSAMVNPLECNALNEEQLGRLFARAIDLGAAELDIWNIDVATTPEKVASILEMILKYCGSHGIEAKIDVLPFVWDELEWAYPRYQK